MGKKAQSNEKMKNAIFKSKYAPVKKKGVKDKPEAKQKGLKKQTKALEKEYKALAIKYQGVEGQAASMLELISQLQLESRDIKDSLALEVENTAHVRDRLDSLETHKELDQEELAALKQQLERQARLVSEARSRLEAVGELAALKQQLERQAGLVSEARSRLEAVGQLVSQSASLKEQIEYLQAGKSEMESSISNIVMQGNVLKSDSQGLGSRFESLSSGFDDVIQRMEESAGRDQVIDAWMEKMNQADSDLLLQLGQQQERVQELVERAEKLDHAAHEATVSYRALQEQVRGLTRSLITAKKQLVGKNAELEKKSLQLESDYQRLTAKHGRLAGSVLVGGLLLLILGGAAYWAKFRHLDDRTSIAVVQRVERISEQVKQHERRLANQEQQISASQEMVVDNQGLAPPDLDARFESMSRSYDAMDERLDGIAEEQHEITVKYVQLGAIQVEMGRQLEQTQGLLVELVGKAEGGKTVAKEQEQKQRMIEDHIQSTQPQPKVESDQHTAGKVKDSAWLQGLSPRHYTIQIYAAHDAAVVHRTASREDLQEATMAIHKGEFNQRDWYTLLYGEYSTIREAKSAIQNLPEDIRAGGPWIRNLSSIQSDLAE